jgi:hypothetical protein
MEVRGEVIWIFSGKEERKKRGEERQNQQGTAEGRDRISKGRDRIRDTGTVTHIPNNM